MNYAISQSFKQAIKNGTGEAIFILLNNPIVNLDELILEACTHNLAYDPQCEGTRADYLFEILSLASNKEILEDAIINNLLEPHEDDRDTELLFDLGKTLALNGHQKAKKALYQRYAKNSEPGYEFVDTDALVILDGIKGLEFSAEIQGKNILLDSKYWTCDWLIQICIENFPDNSPKQHLLDKSKNNIYLQKYLSKIDEINNLAENRKPDPEWSYSSISEFISKGKGNFVPPRAGKKLSKDELVKLTVDFQQASDKKSIETYLRLFAQVKYPGDISYIIPFLRSSNDRIVYLVLSTLSKIKDPIIRDIIESNYQDQNFLKANLRLFVSNYKAKDIKILSNLIEHLEDEDDIHSVLGDLIKILENNIIEKPGIVLNPFYRINNCSSCRKAMIKRLMLSKDVSGDIFQELKYDCDQDIRELSNNYVF